MKETNMKTNEPKLKVFVKKWNKRNVKIQQRRDREKVVITYTRTPLLKEDLKVEIGRAHV